MKQSITLEQWNELSDEETYEYLRKQSDDSLPTIGQLIEYLGDDWWKKEPVGNQDDGWIVRNEYLIDALFEAVKFKLLDNGKQ